MPEQAEKQAEQVLEAPAEQTTLPAKPPAPTKEGGGVLLPLLTTLLAVVGVGELALSGYIGINTYRGVQAQRAYEAQLAAAQTTSSPTPKPGSYYGPWRKIIDGETVWTIEDETPPPPEEPSSTQLGQTSAPEQTPSANSGTISNGTGSAGNNGTYTHDFSGGKVLATSASNNNGDPVYHTKDCVSARKIAPNDELWYSSATEAEADGRRLCGNCD